MCSPECLSVGNLLRLILVLMKTIMWISCWVLLMGCYLIDGNQWRTIKSYWNSTQNTIHIGMVVKMVLNGIVVNKLKLPSCQIISRSLVWVFVKYSSEGPIWGPGWAEFIRLLWFWHGWEWSGKITFTCLSQISCYNQILINILINNCQGAGPKTWQGFLQNPLATEEKGSKDLSERCQVLLWGMYVTSFLIGLLLYSTVLM